ncbi:V-set and transmembrane domain-containing protein 5 [Sphaerodactylus townsendi]|uniref:V-set and transmembrane domain-containing protein 5 n=1 Tax=Sphaerodactylus townsendi TaxID=933632 RepID=UPI002027595D|nr:V-set and transmembrane domain-containing protein 5 [Sphaerodactylus townsendi]
MRPLAGPLRIGILFLTVGWTLQREVSLHVSQPSINATVAQNILLSVAYTCKGVPVIGWKHTATWGTSEIIEWKPGTYTNISSSYRDRVNIYSNGSLQILNVAMRDSGYYLVKCMEEPLELLTADPSASRASAGQRTRLGHRWVLLGPAAPGHCRTSFRQPRQDARGVACRWLPLAKRCCCVSTPSAEILYEDLHFVAVFFAFLIAVSAVLICLMWLCNKSLHLLQKERHQLKESVSATEETELQEMGC